jgi:hypothetical protein
MIQRASLRFQVKNFEKQNRPLLSFGGFYKNWRNSIYQVERFDASDTNRSKTNRLAAKKSVHHQPTGVVINYGPGGSLKYFVSPRSLYHVLG